MSHMHRSFRSPLPVLRWSWFVEQRQSMSGVKRGSLVSTLIIGLLLVSNRPWPRI
jgi:hypothetical protein